MADSTRGEGGASRAAEAVASIPLPDGLRPLVFRDALRMVLAWEDAGDDPVRLVLDLYAAFKSPER